MSNEDFEVKIKELIKKIPFQWRVQSYSPKDNPTKATMVAYIDARDAMKLLDEIVGPLNWQSKYKMVGDKMYAGVGIYNPTIQQWIWKWDVGKGDAAIEEDKSEASDSFKRACVKWQIGRFLYDMEILHVKAKKSEYGKGGDVIDDAGKVVPPWKLQEFASKKLAEINSGQRNAPAETKAEPEKKKEADKKELEEKETKQKSADNEEDSWDLKNLTPEQKKHINAQVSEARNILNDQTVFNPKDGQLIKDALNDAIEKGAMQKVISIYRRTFNTKKKHLETQN